MAGTHPNRLIDALTWPRTAAVAAAAALTLTIAACSGASTTTPTAPSTAVTPAAASTAGAATAAVPTSSPTATTDRLRARATTTPEPGGAQAAPAAGKKGKGGDHSSQTLTADDVLKALKRRGLPLGTTTSLIAATDPDGQLGKPGEYSARLHFADTSLGTPSGSPTVDDGGAVEVFATAKDAARAKRALTASNPPETVYQKGNIVLLLSSRLATDQVSSYELALKQAFKLARKQAIRAQVQQGATPSPTPTP